MGDLFAASPAPDFSRESLGGARNEKMGGVPTNSSYAVRRSGPTFLGAKNTHTTTPEELLFTEEPAEAKVS